MTQTRPDPSNWLEEYIRSEHERLKQKDLAEGKLAEVLMPLREFQAGLNNYPLMVASEGAAARSLEAMSFYTAQYNSWTEADVWGYREVEGYAHLALVQCKSTREPEIRDLSLKESSDLQDFAEVQTRRFPAARPREHQHLPLVVTCGYAGYTVDESCNPPHATLKFAKYINAFGSDAYFEAFPRATPKTIDQAFIDQWREIHRLGLTTR